MLKVLVVGCGVSGLSATRLLLAQGWQVWIADKHATFIKNKPEVQAVLQQGAKLQLEDAYEDITAFNLVVLSPGISHSIPLIQRIKQSNIEIIGELELAFRHAKQPILGITGTNGKTTVTLLVSHVLTVAGQKARAWGNVGEPLAAAIMDLAADEIIVAEMSSYQLETLHSPVIDCGVILNITPDHCERYASMDGYAAAKIHLKNCLKPFGKLLVEGRCYNAFPHLFGSFVPILYGYDPAYAFFTDCQYLYHYGEKILELPASLKGSPTHHLENFIAAYALCAMQEISIETFLDAYATFQKPKHRIEFVSTIAGVHFFDDSKGTNIDAVIRAVETMPSHTILIVGGVDKGASYTSWIQAFSGKVKAIYAIGQAASRIQQELQHAFSVVICHDLETAVQTAMAKACIGETILLSPGCSSFDMFRDYAHRGEEFQRLVRNLKEGE